MALGWNGASLPALPPAHLVPYQAALHRPVLCPAFAPVSNTFALTLFAMADNMAMSEVLSMRLDKWLWAARFYKTRSLAVEQITKGRVSVNAAAAKASREVRVGDTIALRQGHVPKTVKVLGLSMARGPAPVAQALYEETAESQAERARLAEERRLSPEPADSIALQHDGRPTKRNRRDIERTRHQWNDRWSVQWDGN